VKPRLVVETGLGLGGGTLFYASMLELIGQPGEVAGIDVRVLDEVRADLSRGPLARRIRLVEGSSTSDGVLEEVRRLASGGGPVMVVLDSHHTREHVLKELELYSPLVTPGSFLVVLDTAIADLPPEALRGAPFGPGNDPAAAVSEFLRTAPQFVPERRLDQALAITSAPGGFLRRVAS
jgi:cephalosporin hydroxylase